MMLDVAVVVKGELKKMYVLPVVGKSPMFIGVYVCSRRLGVTVRTAPFLTWSNVKKEQA